MRLILIAMLGFLLCGCTTARSHQQSPFSVDSPALEAYCGVPISEMISESSGKPHPAMVDRPVVWSKPLRTPSLAAVLPYTDCIRICRPSDPYWHWIDYATIAIRGDEITILVNDNDALRVLKEGALKFSRESAELMLLAFAELRGYQIITEPPDPVEVSRRSLRGDVHAEVSAVDWSLEWTRLEDGWEVSCVIVVVHENFHVTRYRMRFHDDGNIELMSKEHVFVTHRIMMSTPDQTLQLTHTHATTGEAWLERSSPLVPRL